MFAENGGMKRCVKCGLLQPLSSFYKAAARRACRAKARYPMVREANIARARKWREDNLERFQANQRRMRSTPEAKVGPVLVT
jgi:hypothetical protein